MPLHTPPVYMLETARDALGIDAQGRIVSFTAKSASYQQFILDQPEDPAFIVEYLDEYRLFRNASPLTGSLPSIALQHEAGRTVLTARHERVAGLNLAVTTRIACSPEGEDFVFDVALENPDNLCVTAVQYPFVVVPYQLQGGKGTECVLHPYWCGRLWKQPQPQNFQPDTPHTWQFRPENFGMYHYPGVTFAQFLAYYNDCAGLYMACDDHEGHVKQIKPAHRGRGIRLGMAHAADWTGSMRQLGYQVHVRSFAGDWYAAADIYRGWVEKQPFASRKLIDRTDVPEWVLDSPPHIAVRMQGQLDEGPAWPNEAFLPYPKIIPYLEKLSEQLDHAPLVPIIMSWERPGPWIYPDCFPPVGGDDSLREFGELAHARGWHPGVFCNGTRWVLAHFWSGYDGWDHYREERGEETVCRTFDGKPWPEAWDGPWRPSYFQCMALDRTRQMAGDTVKRLMGDGIDMIQFLDQNCGCCTYPCFADDHGHPPMPDTWMTQGMKDLFVAFRDAAGDQAGPDRDYAFSVESPPNELFINELHMCDARVIPPGHNGYEKAYIPLYNYLFHEYLVIQGGFGSAPEPVHLELRNAYNLVVGQIPGGVLMDDGELLNRETVNWAPWQPPVGDHDAGLEMLRTATRLRRGEGKPYLVYGSMQHPAQCEGIPMKEWRNNREYHSIETVFHSVWQSPDGHLAVILANWTAEAIPVTLTDSRLGRQVRIVSVGLAHESSMADMSDDCLAVMVPPHGCVMVDNNL